MINLKRNEERLNTATKPSFVKSAVLATGVTVLATGLALPAWTKEPTMTVTKDTLDLMVEGIGFPLRIQTEKKIVRVGDRIPDAGMFSAPQKSGFWVRKMDARGIEIVLNYNEFEGEDANEMGMRGFWASDTSHKARPRSDALRLNWGEKRKFGDDMVSMELTAEKGRKGTASITATTTLPDMGETHAKQIDTATYTEREVHGVSITTTHKKDKPVRVGDFLLRAEFISEVACYFVLKVDKIDVTGIELTTNMEIFTSEHVFSKVRVNFGQERQIGTLKVSADRGPQAGTAMVTVTSTNLPVVTSSLEPAPGQHGIILDPLGQEISGIPFRAREGEEIDSIRVAKIEENGVKLEFIGFPRDEFWVGYGQIYAFGEGALRTMVKAEKVDGADRVILRIVHPGELQ